MARPREFDERAVLDAAVQCFWGGGYEGTSLRELIDRTGLTGASIYNAFGDKRAFYRRALEHYLAGSIQVRLRRYETMAPRVALGRFFDDILERSLADRERKGCMLVNAALEVSSHDAQLQGLVADMLSQIEAFFVERVSAGQLDGTIRSTLPAADLARHLLAVLMGLRVLARTCPQRERLQGAVSPALALLDGAGA
ncbi:MAG: TetR/AcrR family transcriptional regulator [Pseudomonadota bacterium]|nr:TetR/AcrR family transcriptional regulator [Pseudomonadota bacterium]